MTSGTFFWLTNVNCTSRWKKMAHAWWSFYSLYTGEREKNTKINVTFSLSGWAMPFLQRRPGLWQMLRLSPQTEPPWSVCLHRVRRKANIPGILAGRSYLQASGSAPQTPVPPVKRCRTRLIWTHAPRCTIHLTKSGFPFGAGFPKGAGWHLEATQRSAAAQREISMLAVAAWLGHLVTNHTATEPHKTPADLYHELVCK